MDKADRKFKLALICGGNSGERGISLNSARSVMDHVQGDSIDLRIFYVDSELNFYEASAAQLYSNTPSDFDFKLHSTSKKLSNLAAFDELKKVDLVFPVIHGSFGEDGELQSLLEQHDIRFIAHSSRTCRDMFFKRQAAMKLRKHNFKTLPSQLLDKEDGATNLDKITEFFTEHDIKKAVVKPNAGGSSLGVFVVKDPYEAYDKLMKVYENTSDYRAIIEPFCHGTEFTMMVVENSAGSPVALIPSEIQLNYDDRDIFDYRRKYLPTNNTTYYTPARFSEEIIDKIRSMSEEIFKQFGMRDFARMDGWILQNGDIIFTDLNPTSGMEQNSFLFRQASKIGLNHADILHTIIESACRRYNIPPPARKRPADAEGKKKVYILFGGDTAERQVSLMSGTNVWLKLLHSERYLPSPFLLDKEGSVWQLPYGYTIDHTVEEIFEHCMLSYNDAHISKVKDLANTIRGRLNLEPLLEYELPEKLSMQQFIKKAEEEDAFVFLGLHGGDGENGYIQGILDRAGLCYNGSGVEGSKICMDKQLTGEMVRGMEEEEISSCNKLLLSLFEMQSYNAEQLESFWRSATEQLGSSTLIIKPKDEGCSAGVIMLEDCETFGKYLSYFGKDHIPVGVFKNQHEIVELPSDASELYLLENCIEVDKLSTCDYEILYQKKTGWLEMTVGVLEAGGIYHSLSPSVTIAKGAMLSLEEKFQGGTGINITPPPESMVSSEMLSAIKQAIEKVARVLKVSNYARIDIFFNVDTSEVIVIEANTLPALTPATVLYHQALAEPEHITPLELLEHIISSAMSARLSKSA